MAGLYPDAPSRRMGYHDDGTVGFWRRGFDSGSSYGVQTALTPTELAELNDEDNDNVTPAGFAGSGGDPSWFTLIFPELREFDGFFARCNDVSVNRLTLLETSVDTTNGTDGTWVTQAADYPDPDIDVYANYRTVTSYAAGGVRAVRLRLTAADRRIRAMHVYGDITPGETPDRCLFIDELTGVEFTAPIDFAEVPRGGSEDREFRIRNNSAGLTASTVQYTALALYLASGNWYTFTLPGGATFQATRQIASIAAATTTGIITVRRVTPGTETVGLHAAFAHIDVGGWA